MAREDYEAVIGLEVHAELSTKTKLNTAFALEQEIKFREKYRPEI